MQFAHRSNYIVTGRLEREPSRLALPATLEVREGLGVKPTNRTLA
jgi:hypothetical protein